MYFQNTALHNSYRSESNNDIDDDNVSTMGNFLMDDKYTKQEDYKNKVVLRRERIPN